MNDTPKLLPRRLIFANPERRIVRISPGGTHIAFLAPLDGVLNLWVAPLTDIGDAQAVTAVTDRNLGPWIFWTHDDRHVLFFRERRGDENWCLWRINLETGDLRPLTSESGVTSYIQQISIHHPGELLVAHNARDKHYFDLFRINVASGDSSVVHINEGFSGFFTDHQFRVRYTVRHTDSGGVEYLQPDGSDRWTLATQIGFDDLLTTRAVEISDDGSEIYWLDSRGRDTAAVVAQNPESGAIRVLAQDQRADFHTILFDPVTQRPIAAASTFERTRWQVLDMDYAEDFNFLTSQSCGDVAFTGISQDRRNWILAYIHDNAPVEYFHYDRKLRRLLRLFSSMPSLEGAPLAPMRPVTIRARDGLELVSYLTCPLNTRPQTPLPMVLHVHGGPWGRDDWSLNADHQWLANRGYAVLSVNFRGSTGFGKAFVNAANLEWAGKMHDDLIDAVDWAIAAGIADAGRVAIMGTSYGGYSALVGLTFTPEKFACAVDIVGVSNLVTFMNTIPEHWESWKALWKTRMGDFTTEAGRRFLEERSPLNRADRIVRPLLIGQGANDVRVKPSESEQIVEAMQRHNIPVTYVYFPDEGHGFGRPENRRAFAAVAEAFLAAHIGGRIEPIGDDFDGSTIEFKAGRALIPGLD
jgi:dipeptidyl aminopeptidase/acylaminoacyl peptidase